MCEAIILIRYEIWLRPEQNRWPAWLDEQSNKFWGALPWFDANPLQLADPIYISHLALGSALSRLPFPGY
jgi:glutathione S-transferase